MSLAAMLFASLAPALAVDQPSPSPMAQPSLTSPGTTALQLNFGTDRAPRTATAVLIGSPPATGGQAYLLGDLQRSDGMAQLGADMVTVHIEASAADPGRPESRLTLTVGVDPRNAQPGTYTGSVRVVAGGAEPVILPLTVTLKGGPWWLVFILIALGALLGLLAKWLTEAGAALSDASRRYLRYVAQVQPHWDSVPERFKDDLMLADAAIKQLDATAATAELDRIGKEIDNVVQETAVLSGLAQELRVQEALPGQAQVPRASEVLGLEREQLDELLSSTDPAAADALQTLQTRLSQFQAFTTILRDLPTAAEPRKTGLKNAAQLFADNDFAAGAKAVADSADSPVVLQTKMSPRWLPPWGRPAQPGQAGPRTPIERSWWQSASGALNGWLIGSQPWLSALVVGLITAFTGIQLLYFANATFGATVADYLVAFGWGFGLQLAGTTLTQMGSALYGRGPKLI